MKSALVRSNPELSSGWWVSSQGKLLARVLAPLANARRGILTLTLPNGNTLQFGEHSDARLAPHVHLHNWKSLRKALSGGSVGWSEAFMDGDWDSPNLAALIEWVVVNESDFGNMLEGGRLKRWLQRWQHRRNANSKRGSRRNIAYHYDLGNDFYKTWLDDSMTYSSALYESGVTDLGAAQQRKYQRLIDELGVKDGQRILEVGCGWGGFAEQLCRQHDVHLDGITLSEEQLAYAKQRIQDAGLQDRASFSLTDYQDTKGEYDHIVSIEMLEAVGEQYWPTYFATLFKRLKPGGRAAIQVITIDHQRFEGYRDNPDFIQRYIFPGGMLPSPELFRDYAAKAGFATHSELPFGISYADTLAEWDRTFSANWSQIAPLGFDERFRKMWKYYLGYCEGGFRAGSIDVYQFVLQKPLK